MTKYLICGSRKYDNKTHLFVNEQLSKLLVYDIDVVITGACVGVDTFVIEFCDKNNIEQIKVRPVRTDIKDYYLHRNAEMIGMCDEVIAFWDGKSRGTKFVIDYAKARNKEVTIIKIEE